MVNINIIKIIKKQAEKELLKKNKCLSVGIGYKIKDGVQTTELAIICGVKKKLPVEELALEDIIPESIDDVKTDVQEVGEIKALAARTDRIRPALRGVSIGVYSITAGTFGCLVKKNGQTYLLSNNHVFADSNNAKIGDPIIQPGAYDQGVVGSDTIATLSEFVPIKFVGDPSTCPVAKVYAWFGNAIAALFGRKSRVLAYTTAPEDNMVDCAIAKPVNDEMVSALSFEGWAALTGIQEASLGMDVKKSGRTTGTTYGVVSQINATVTVSYGSNKTAVFADQIIIQTKIAGTSFSAGGDSGSAIQNMENSGIALLFAGSDQVTIGNRIQNVIDALEVQIG